MPTTKGTVVAEFVDKYGDTRKIRQIGRKRVSIEKKSDTVSHHLNRAAASLIAQNIKAARIRAGLTLEEACLRAGLKSDNPKERMWDIENAHRKEGLRFGTLYAIALALNCEAASLLPTTEEVRALAGASVEVMPTVAIIAA